MLFIPTSQAFSKSYDVQGQGQTSKGSEGTVYVVVDKMPTPAFDLNEYLATNIQYPVDAVKDSIQGRVVIGFVVEKDGSITNVKVLNSVSKWLDKEAMRIVRGMPKWVPGKQGGYAVRVHYRVTVPFKLPLKK